MKMNLNTIANIVALKTGKKVVIEDNVALFSETRQCVAVEHPGQIVCNRRVVTVRGNGLTIHGKGIMK